MNKLRTPFLIVALLLVLTMVLIEIGSDQASKLLVWLPYINRIEAPEMPLGSVSELFPADQREELETLISNNRDKLEVSAGVDDPPGYGVAMLRFVDGILLFTLFLLTSALIVPESVQAKVQGILTLIFAIALILAALVQIFIILAEVILMISLLLAVPFGTIAYLIVYGSFPVGSAATILSLLFLLKILFIIALLLAHQKFLTNIGLVALTITALVANAVVSVLHGFVPGILVSISDGVAAIVIGIIAIIWAIILLIGSIPAIINAFKPA